MDCSRKDEPHYCYELVLAELGADGFGDEVGSCEEGGAGAEEDGEEGRDTP